MFEFIYFGDFCRKMDNFSDTMFSLEEDENVSELFITQTPRINEEKSEITDESSSCGILGVDGFDFSMPCSSLINDTTSKSSQYSDISDVEDDFVNPVYGRGVR